MMSGETKLEAYPGHNFCMKKPASTIINKAKISVDILEKYILQPFVFDIETPWSDMVPEQFRELLRETHERPKPSDGEVGRNFYRTNVGATVDQGLFFNSESDPYIPKIEGLSPGVIPDIEQGEKCVELLGKEIGGLLGLTGKRTDLAKKIMNYVDTTSLPSYTFPALVDAAFQTTPPIFRCMVGSGYIFVFIYYYLPMGAATLMGTGRIGDGKYSSFVVRTSSNNLYLDEYDESSGTIQIFPTDESSINNIVDTDEPFRESFIAANVGSAADSRPVSPTKDPSPTVSRVATPEEAMAMAEQFKGKNPTSGYPGSKASEWVAAIENDD